MAETCVGLIVTGNQIVQLRASQCLVGVSEEGHVIKLYRLQVNMNNMLLFFSPHQSSIIPLNLYC